MRLLADADFAAFRVQHPDRNLQSLASLVKNGDDTVLSFRPADDLKS
jgi:hypothetical protein